MHLTQHQLQPKVDCILRFKDPKPSDDTIKAKFAESNGAKVSEQIRGYKTGNNKANLVALMNQMVTLGDLYEMWENEKSKKLAQTMLQALEGQVRDDWQEIMSERDKWDEDEQKQKFVQMLQTVGTKTFGPKVPKQSLCIGTYWLIQINQLMPYLGIYAQPYSMEELNKIIVKKPAHESHAEVHGRWQ